MKSLRRVWESLVIEDSSLKSKKVIKGLKLKFQVYNTAQLLSQEVFLTDPSMISNTNA